MVANLLQISNGTTDYVCAAVAVVGDNSFIVYSDCRNYMYHNIDL